MQQKGAVGELRQHVCYVRQSCKPWESSAGILYKTLSKQCYHWDKRSQKHLTRLFLLSRVSKKDTKGRVLPMVCSGSRTSLYRWFLSSLFTVVTGDVRSVSLVSSLIRHYWLLTLWVIRRISWSMWAQSWGSVLRHVLRCWHRNRAGRLD